MAGKTVVCVQFSLLGKQEFYVSYLTEAAPSPVSELYKNIKQKLYADIYKL